MPGALYVLVNNIRFPILERIDPGVFAVLWNLKVVGVAALLACLLSRPITGRQWGGIAMLVLGSTLAEISQWYMRCRSIAPRSVLLLALVYLYVDHRRLQAGA